MKTTIKTLVLLTIAIGTFAFTSNQIERKYIKEGTITWTGKKVIGSHTGTLDLKSGYLEMDGDKLTGGMFEVDMTSIKNTDIEGGGRGKLEGHLKNEDFFNVAEFPIATMTIKDVLKKGDVYEVVGNFTIKGVTEIVKFEMEISSSQAKATVVIDRTKYGIKYGSGDFFDDLGDRAILNDFDLDVVLKF